jgi:hypothetical protein
VAVIEARQRAEDRAEARTRTHRFPTLVAAFLALLMLVSIGIAQPVAANGGGGTQAARVIAAVEGHLGARYRWGSTGPYAFDCSGLVYRAFKEAKLVGHIGGFNTAHGYYRSFQRRGKTSTSNGQPGDIVVYSRGGHVGIYLGHGKVVSALLSGVKVHPLKGLDIRFTTFIHLGLSGDSTSLAASRSKASYRRADQRIPMRAKPGRHARVIRKVNTQDKLTVLSTSGHGTWLHVRLSNDHTGWVRTSLTHRV